MLAFVIGALLGISEQKLSWVKLDKYGRDVANVFVVNIDVGLEQVCDGMAWHFRAYEKDQGASARAAYAATREAGQLNDSKCDEYSRVCFDE